MDKSLGLEGTTFFIHLQGEQGQHPTGYVGDDQTTDNIEAAVDTGLVYEAWLQKSMEQGRFSALLGLYDLNSEFYVNAPAALFINSSFGVGRDLSQTGKNGPSIFPVTSVALRLRAQPSTEYYVQTALLDGVSGDPKHPYGTHIIFKNTDGYLWVSEIGWTPSENNQGEYIGKIALGTWTYTATFDHLTQKDGSGNPTQKINTGYYFLVDYYLTKDAALFFRYGEAMEAVNSMKSNLSGGVYVKGLLPKRGEDELGLGVAIATRSKYYKQAQIADGSRSEDAETAYELTYKYVFNDRFSVQPDLQYVVNPGTDPSLKDSLSGILRLRYSF